MRRIRGILVATVLVGALSAGPAAPAEAAALCPGDGPTCVVEMFQPCLEGPPSAAPGCITETFRAWCAETVCYAVEKLNERLFGDCFQDVVACLLKR